jgi:uncharacterized protein
MNVQSMRLDGGDPVRDRASLFAIPIWDWWLLYAPRQGVLQLTDRSRLAELAAPSSALLERPGPPGTGATPTQTGPETMPDGCRTGPLNPEFLGIIPTRACNLACRYCAFGANRSGATMMSQSLAKEAVDWMAFLVQENGRHELRVDLFGGEPMQAPEVVKAVIHRARQRASELGLHPHLEIATNGCLTGAAARLLAEGMTHVVLSLDGPEEVQDAHRPMRNGEGTFRTVVRNAQEWVRGPTRLSVRACVTRDTLDLMEHTTEWFCRTFQPSAVNFEPLRATAESERAGLHPPDPWQFAGNFHRASRVASRMGVPMVFAAALVDRLRTSFCPVGQDVVIVSPDGTAHACYLLEDEWQRQGLDLRLGTFQEGGRVAIDPERVQRVRSLAADCPECTSCFCRWSCAGGCHVAMHRTRRKAAPEDFCISTRLLTACRLLDRLGDAGLADRFIQDRTACERLVFQPSDAILEVAEHLRPGCEYSARM